MTVSSKDRILRHFNENRLLATPAPPMMPRTPHDLRGDQPQVTIASPTVAAAAQALQSGQTHYVDVPGIAPLRAAIASLLNESFRQSYETEHVLITAGVQESRFLTIQKIGEQFEELILPSVVHPGVRRVMGTRSLPYSDIPVDETSGMLASLDAIRTALKPGRRLLFLESPARLTGKTYSPEAVAALVSLVQEYESGIIWDQGLAPWQLEERYVTPAETSEVRDRVAVLGEAWPGTGLDSWFIGYIAAGSTFFEPMVSQKQIMAICTNTASQYAALAAAEAFRDQHPFTLANLIDKRNQVAATASEMGFEPLPGSTASLLAIRPSGDVPAIQKSLGQAGFAVADGTDFGAPGVLRLQIMPDNTTVEALQRLA